MFGDNENKLNTNDFAVSNLFNDKFVSISKISTASSPTISILTEVLDKIEKSLVFYPTEVMEISKYAQNLRNHKAAGLDGLTAKTIKVSIDVICDRLTYFVNESLSSGVFPKILTAVKVVPIFKSGKKSNCENYTPISISSVQSKVLERVDFARLYKFMQLKQLFYCRQFGFRQKLSTL